MSSQYNCQYKNNHCFHFIIVFYQTVTVGGGNPWLRDSLRSYSCTPCNPRGAGHLHQRGEGAGHRAEAEAGDRRVGQQDLHLRPLQGPRGAASAGGQHVGGHRQHGGQPHGAGLPHEQQVGGGHFVAFGGFFPFWASVPEWRLCFKLYTFNFYS